MNQVVPITLVPVPIRFYGASVNRDTLTIVAIEKRGDRFETIEAGSAEFKLPDESGIALRYFKKSVEAHLAVECLAKIVLRIGQHVGKFQCGPLIIRIESALELIEGLKVLKVHHQSLRTWQDIHKGELDKPDSGLPMPQVESRWHATVAARLSYGLHHEGHKLKEGKIKY